MKILPSIISSLFITLISFSLAGQKSAGGTNIPASKVIEAIIKNTGSPTIPNTVDIIKEGSPDTPVKGIVTTMFASIDVLRQAVNKNCNLIIVHEPLLNMQGMPLARAGKKL